MKCEKGDLAEIIYSIRESNRGKLVVVDTFIGYFNAGDSFDFNGYKCEASISDNYWWVAAEHGLASMFGDSPKLYIPDTWLEPIKPTVKAKSTHRELDLIL